MSNELSNMSDLKRLVESDDFKKKINDVLGANAGSFVASITTLVSQDGKLKQCKAGDILRECLKSASLKLPIVKDLGCAYIIPYYNVQKDEWGRPILDEKGNRVKKFEPQFQIAWGGYVQLANRSGLYECLNADVVYDGELLGVDKLSGKINLNGKKKSDKVVGYFAHYKMLNGLEHTIYMSVEEMALYAKKFSPSCTNVSVEQLIEIANAPQSERKELGWMGDFTNMALKTCVKRLIKKWGAISIESYSSDMSKALAMDGKDVETVDEVAEEVVDIEEPKALEATTAQPVTAEMQKAVEQTPVVKQGIAPF